MKRTLLLIVSVIACVTVMKADDRPVTPEQLPNAARNFIETYYPETGVLLATKDDDFIRPEYNVVLENGVAIQFENDGRLEKINTRNGAVPAGIVPEQILEFVRSHYPDAFVTEYEIGRKSYEVKLSNRMELEFNSSFILIEIDD